MSSLADQLMPSVRSTTKQMLGIAIQDVEERFGQDAPPEVLAAYLVALSANLSTAIKAMVQKR